MNLDDLCELIYGDGWKYEDKERKLLDVKHQLQDLFRLTPAAIIKWEKKKIPADRLPQIIVHFNLPRDVIYRGL